MNPCSLGFDLFIFVIGLYILLQVVRWGLSVIVPEVQALISELKVYFGSPQPEPKKRVRVKKAPQLEEGKVFNVGSLDGRTEIVHAKDDAEAIRVGAESLRVPEEDVVVAEVYDKVVGRK